MLWLWFGYGVVFDVFLSLQIMVIMMMIKIVFFFVLILFVGSCGLVSGVEVSDEEWFQWGGFGCSFIVLQSFVDWLMLLLEEFWWRFLGEGYLFFVGDESGFYVMFWEGDIEIVVCFV